MAQCQIKAILFCWKQVQGQCTTSEGECTSAARQAPPANKKNSPALDLLLTKRQLSRSPPPRLFVANIASTMAPKIHVVDPDTETVIVLKNLCTKFITWSEAVAGIAKEEPRAITGILDNGLSERQLSREAFPAKVTLTNEKDRSNSIHLGRHCAEASTRIAAGAWPGDPLQGSLPPPVARIVLVQARDSKRRMG
ncbi:uncharacterized protein M421DRAFT_397443 [Didymella exigua CBS 183.55]|uniref:Uncharacterized protein n=1 Tax=Didymella exigua CBS 183.55 TaxID=1150837 RepID=A0A6A5RI92_9PLEO|nr:uncharacterized protein M421DRAFT_397443 [Didymella exigua CBS 183.55]KAF1926156.1 hypothetical protein M421DRAFT_397443 [Didymella exigua CBS 183.55]